MTRPSPLLRSQSLVPRAAGGGEHCQSVQIEYSNTAFGFSGAHAQGEERVGVWYHTR